MITIRFANEKDKQQVLGLIDELAETVSKKKGTPNNDRAQQLGASIFDEMMHRDDTKIFVAEQNEKLVGLVTFYILPNIHHGWHRGHIEDFVVSESVRGQGIGTKLFDAIKAYCKGHNIKVIKLDSNLVLTEAHRFYEKNGGKFTEKMFRFDL